MKKKYKEYDDITEELMVKNLDLTQFLTFLSPNHFKVQLNITENQSFKGSFAHLSFSLQN